jgi:predicted O-methyltransferase YrrM
MEELALLRPPACLERILQRTAEIGFAMASEMRTGAMLRALAASKPAGRLLELGTGTGVASAWLRDGMDASSQLISIDPDPAVQEIARETFAGDSRVVLLTEDANSFLDRQPHASFDLVFADAMAGKYENLEKALAVVRAGGFYIVDDLLPQTNWPAGHAPKVPVLIRELMAHPEFTAVPLAWASGLVVAVRTSVSALSLK